MRHPIFFLILLLAGCRAALFADPFSVVVYNVENLFDVDGLAAFEDYQPAGPENPEGYTNRHFLTKLTNITRLLQQVGGGRGPDVILFQEMEGDRTPEKWHGDLVRFLADHTDSSVEELLTEKFTEALSGVPAEIWLYKMMADAGMRDYFISVAEHPENSGRPIAHVNITFSRFPISSVRTLQSPSARGTLETELDVNGHSLYLFNAHWKSGASSTSLERVRVENARVVRDRIDQILRQDPAADIIVGGDLNSQYNQIAVLQSIKETGINSILKAQGDETALLQPRSRDLYNLWFELPPERRGSDVYQGKWGTLMHIILSGGLYDFHGIQYIDNSFARLQKPGMNADLVTGSPIRWAQVGNGAGYSDHFPLLAWFQVVPDGEKNRFLALKNPSKETVVPTELFRVDYAAADLMSAPRATVLTAESPLQGPDHYGKVLLVESVVSGKNPLQVTVGQETFQIWSFDEEIRTRLDLDYSIGKPFSFYGELNRFRGNWQFIIQHENWLDVPRS